MSLEMRHEVTPNDFEVGVIICRMQVHKLHTAHHDLIKMVCDNHKKVIIFLGVSVIPNTKQNPLDYATRAIMITSAYPNVIVLPNYDQRSDETWSKEIDKAISTPYGDKKALLYGSRDSFIPHYKGKHTTTELKTNNPASGTQVREDVSREVINSEDFRAGIIYATYARRPVTYSTVDIVAYNDDNKILMAKKPGESDYRFIGGFVDRSDTNWEHAAKREFGEETTNSEIDDLRYIGSAKIHDWRYEGLEDGIMTTLFLGKYIFGPGKPSDDIASLHWLDPLETTVNEIMPEHRELFTKLKITFESLTKLDAGVVD